MTSTSRRLGGLQLEAIQLALETAGVEFISEIGGGRCEGAEKRLEVDLTHVGSRQSGGATWSRR